MTLLVGESKLINLSDDDDDVSGGDVEELVLLPKAKVNLSPP